MMFFFRTQTTETRILVEEYEDNDIDSNIGDFVVDEIEKILNTKGVCGVHLRNGQFDYESTFDHLFIITEESNNFYRIESYVDLYPERKLEWNSWREDIKNLFNSPISDSLSIWNKLFSSMEKKDNNLQLDAELITTV